MEEEVTQGEESNTVSADGNVLKVGDEGDTGSTEERREMENSDVDSPTDEGEPSKALKKSIGLGLPSDRYRIALLKGSFPPITGRQQFIARLRDRDRVSFRIFEGDEEIASQNEFLGEIGMAGIGLNNEDKAFLELDFHLNVDRLLTVRLVDRYGEREAYMTLDLAKSPRTVIKQDTVVELIEKMESLERRINELGKRGNHE